MFGSEGGVGRIYIYEYIPYTYIYIYTYTYIFLVMFFLVETHGDA